MARDIVCFANDWAGDPLSKKHVMRRLARRHRVLWVDSLGNRAPRIDGHDARRVIAKLQRAAAGVREVEPNVWVLSPLAVPVYGSRAAAMVNARVVAWMVRRAMAQLGFSRPLLYSFVPASAWVLGRLDESAVVYHCVDEYSAFAGAGPEIARLEELLLRAADRVLVCSEPLRVGKARLSARPPILVRHGVDHAHFASALDEQTVVAPQLANLPRPIIGFHGLIAEWVDLGLVRRVADAMPSASVVLVGEVRASQEPLAGARNVHVMGRVPYAELPRWLRGFDAGILPFVIDELTLNANPLKLREYLAAGLPVVATALPEAEALAPQVAVARGDDEFVRLVEQAVAVREPWAARQARSAAMAGETWDGKVAEIEEILDDIERDNEYLVAQRQQEPLGGRVVPGHREV